MTFCCGFIYLFVVAVVVILKNVTLKKTTLIYQISSLKNHDLGTMHLGFLTLF